MASIVVAGDTSGTVTLAAPAVSGTTTLTLPTTSGTIVTTSGSQTIEFADGSASTPSITNSGDTNTGMFFPAADTIAFAEGGTEAMRLDSSGNVGIGTSTFAFANRLNVKQSADNSAVGLGARIERNANDSSLFLGYRDNSDSWQINASYSSTGAFKPITFHTSDTERMRIDSSGSVLIGKTTQALTSNGWALYPDEGSNYAFDMGGATNECFNYNNTGTGTYDVAFRYQATVKGYIRVNSTNTTYSTTSDYRLKENIAPMVGALEKVVQLKPVTYTWKADGSDGQGFIAHELQAVIPDAVVGEKDAVETYTDEEGNEQTRIKAQGIDTSFLVATLTAAIQEQQTIIESLKTDIAELKAKVK